MELDKFRNVDLVINHVNDNFFFKQFVSQNDNDGRTLTVQVTSEGIAGKIHGLSLNLRWSNQANGLTDLSAFECIDANNSIFQIFYPDNMLNPGKVIASIQIIQDGKVAHSKQFEITVQQLSGEMKGIVSSAEYSALVQTLSDANKFRTDIDTLADSKADWEDLNQTDANLDALNQKKADKTSLSATNAQVASLNSSKVDKGGNEQVTLPMLSQDVKESMTGGSVAVVGPDAVNTTNIANRAVDWAKVKGYMLKARLVFGNGLANFDSGQKTVTFNGKTGSEDYVILAFENWQFNYTIPIGTVLTAEGTTTYAYKIVFNLTNKALRLTAWSERIADDDVTVTIIYVQSRPIYVVGETQLLIDGKISEIYRDPVIPVTSQNTGNEHVKSIAHQGFNENSPGNVIPAFELAKKKGFFYVETDIKKTSDGIFVLCHDNSINNVARNTDGSAIEEEFIISDHTYDELNAYDYGIKYGSQYAGVKLAKLEDLLLLCKKNNMHPYLEIKIDTRYGVADQICALIKKYGMQNDVTIFGTNIVMVKEFISKLPKLRLGWVLSSAPTQTEIDEIKAIESESIEVFLDLNHTLLTADVATLLSENNVDFEIWTLDDANLAENYVSLGVSGITTNNINFNALWNSEL